MTPEDARRVLAPIGVDGVTRPVQGGERSWVFDVDSRWIARFPKSDVVAACHDREQRLLQELQKHVSFAVPVAEKTGTCNGRPFHVYRKIVGLDLGSGPFNERAVAAMLREVHSFPAEPARQLLDADGTVQGWRRHYDVLRLQVEQRVTPMLDSNLAARLDRAYDLFLADPMEFEPTLVHGDLGVSHVLCDEAGAVEGVIDWEEVTVGDPAIDLAALWTGLGTDRTRPIVRQHGRADRSARQRLYFYRAMGAVHAILFLLDEGDEAGAASAIAELDRRLTNRDRVCAAVVRGDHILMVRYHDLYWTLPGGGVEPGETPEEAVVRELSEEAGVEGRVIRRLFDERYSMGESFCYLVETAGEPRVTGDAQVTEVAWLRLDEMADDGQVMQVIAALRQ